MSRELYEPYARQAAYAYGVDPDIFVRMITVESGWNPTAVSSAGACGIAQIVPKYHPGVNCWDPYESLDYAARLIASYLQRYGGSYAHALACYNCGCGCVDSAVSRCGENWVSCLPGETQRYLALILGLGAVRPTVNGTGPVPAGSGTLGLDAGTLVPLIAALMVVIAAGA